MYTVGQVAKFLGISRDTLKFYEEKNLINPIQDEENGYRRYNVLDINEIVTVNFYRDIDIEIKKIQEIKNGESLDTIEAILDEKRKKLEDEIEYKKLLLKRTNEIKADYNNVKENLNKFTIREMKPIIVTGEIRINEDDVSQTYTEILQKHDSTNRLKKPVNLVGVSRIVYFNEKDITSERYILYKKLDDNKAEEGEVISYPKCIYIVIAVPIVNDGDNIDKNMGESITETANSMGYKTKGMAFINMLFNGYKDGQNVQYLEVYTPVV